MLCWIKKQIRQMCCNHDNELVYEFKIGDYAERKYRCSKCEYSWTVKEGKLRKWR